MGTSLLVLLILVLSRYIPLISHVGISEKCGNVPTQNDEHNQS